MSRHIIIPLPNEKILALTKLKAFSDDKFNFAKTIMSGFNMVENIVGKGENAGKPAFSSFPTMFSKDFFIKVIKSRENVW